MREVVDASRVRSFMRALGDHAELEGRLFFTGGVSAVLFGWRSSTVDVDIKVVPEPNALFSVLPRIKESLHINVELAAPDQFIPELPGWQDRSLFIEQHGRLAFFHYDFYAQALAKVERGHVTDLDDVREMLGRGLIESTQARRLFADIEPGLPRYPAIDPASFRRAVEAAFPTA
jgi:hypothetical protein